MYFFFVTLSFLCLQVIESFHESNAKDISDKVEIEFPDGPYIDALKYLGRYGYLNLDGMKNFSMFDSFEKSVKSFQGFFGLRESGELDNETVTAMRKPRCGVRDLVFSKGEVKEVELSEDHGKKRQKRYSFYDSFFFQDMMDLFGSRMRPFDTPSR